jgi:hypothetical protein
MGSRTNWFVVNAVIALRNRELVQYEQDDMKIETLPGVSEHLITFILEADEHSNEDLLRELVLIRLKSEFHHSPKLEDTATSPTFEVKDLSFTKAKFVFHVVTRR